MSPRGRIFFLRINSFFFWCSLLFGLRSIPVLPQWHVKNLGHSAKSTGGRLHLNTHTPLTQRSRTGLTMLPRLSVGTYREKVLTLQSSGNTRSQSSGLAEPPWTGPGLKSRPSVSELISPLKKRKKKVQARTDSSNFPQNPGIRGKSHRRHHFLRLCRGGVAPPERKECAFSSYDVCWWGCTVGGHVVVIKCSLHLDHIACLTDSPPPSLCAYSARFGSSQALLLRACAHFVLLGK